MISRVDVLEYIRRTPGTTAEIAEAFGIGLKNMSAHISKLHAYGYVEVGGWKKENGKNVARIWRACVVQPFPIRRKNNSPQQKLKDAAE